MNVTDNIKAIRKKKGLTQTEVAKRYGTSPEFYHRLEKKNETLTLEQLEKIATALEVSIAELLGYSNKENNLKTLKEKIAALEKENEDLKDKLSIYQPMSKMVEFMFNNPTLMENFANKASKKITEEDVNEALPGMKEVIQESIKSLSNKDSK